MARTTSDASRRSALAARLNPGRLSGSGIMRKLFVKKSAFESPKDTLQRRMTDAEGESHQRRRSPRIPVEGWTVEIEGKGYPVKNWNFQGFLAASYDVDREPGDSVAIYFSAPLDDGGFQIMRRAKVVRIDKNRMEFVGIFTDPDHDDVSEDKPHPFAHPVSTNVSQIADSETARDIGVKLVAIAQLHPNDLLKRGASDDQAIQSLADSIKDRGVLQPILVRPHPERSGDYEVVAGSRRLRAAEIAEFDELPVLVQDLSDGEALQIALIENLQREDLTPIEEAEGYHRLIEEFAQTQDSLAQAVSRSRSHIANTMRLLKLTPELRGMVQSGHLTAGHARALLKVTDPEELARQVINGGLSVRETEFVAQRAKKIGAKTSKSNGAAGNKQDVAQIERDLSALFNMTVKISKRGKGGTMTFSYDNMEKCNQVIRRLTPKSDLPQLRNRAAKELTRVTTESPRRAN